jgi:DNA-binding LacI/PurR family transcriptional regulator
MADVAKRAGVAVSTVSYALSGVRPVAEGTRQRILAAIAELGYHPNLLARGLAGKHTRVVALLYPSVVRGLSQVQLEFVNAAAQVASERNYALLLWTSPGEDGEILRLTKEGLVEGLILMEIKLHDPRVETLRTLGYPFCLIGHTQYNEGISFVDFDFDGAMHQATRHLSALGHRDIAYLIHSPVPIEQGYGPAVRSLAGVQAAAAENGIRATVFVLEATTQAAYETTRALLEDNPSPTAAVTTSDALCTGIMQAVRDHGLAIPDGFSIGAVLTSRFAEAMSPPITAVELPVAEMGRIGADILINRLEGGEHPPTQLVLPPQLTIRQSTAAPRQRPAPPDPADSPLVARVAELSD